MYFSLITPDHENLVRAAGTRLQGPYADHQWLWKFFSSDEDQARDFLFRRTDVQGASRYYLVSRRRPESSQEGWTVQSRNYAPVLEAGTQLQFELRANPVVTHQRDGKRKRDDVVMHAKRERLQARGLNRWKDWHGDDKPPLYELVNEACTKWLLGRAAKFGFSVAHEALRVDGYLRHREKHGALRFSTVDFSGTLMVTDPERFQRALFNGIGPAKAFGCGLLLVRRA